MPPIETPFQRRRRLLLAAQRAERAGAIDRAALLNRRAAAIPDPQPVRARVVVPRAVPRPVEAAPERPRQIAWFAENEDVRRIIERNELAWRGFMDRHRVGEGQAAAPPAPAPEPPVRDANIDPFWDDPPVMMADMREMEQRVIAARNVIPQAQNPPSVAKIEKEADEMPERLANTFLVGCDPEFVVMDKADTVFNVVNAGIGAKGEVGYDHSGLVLEIRPSAAKGTYALMKRIKQIIDNNDKLKLVNGKKWRAGAVVKTKLVDRGGGGLAQPERTLTLGGHVHLDLPPVGYGGVDQELHNIRLSAMDRMTKYLEGLDILPKNESAVRRVEGAKAMHGSRYGQWGDWRPAGGEAERTPVRLEYRTPASWLYSQAATFLTLTGVKLAMVSPQLAMDTLKIRNVSYENLKAFFELYRHKDANARRVLDCLLDKRVEDLQADPDRDVREAWKTLEF